MTNIKIPLLLLLSFSFLIVSCERKFEYVSKPSSNPLLIEGEWLDSSDTIHGNGISIRKNKIAFFKNMHFTADQIHDYYIIDSIYRKNGNDQKIGEYLIIKEGKDSSIFEIEIRNKSSIILLNSKKDKLMYNFWKRIKFTPK